ncbi:MAG: helix-turn-helix domain-containing protein [Kiritimatiellales bacterium]
MVDDSINTQRDIPAEYIRLPIFPERSGLIRYMDPQDALAKPDERFRYDVLALLIIESGQTTYVIDNKVIKLSPLSALWCFPSQERSLCYRTPDFKMWVVEFTKDFLRQTCTEQHDAILKRQHEEFLHRRLPANEFQFMRRIFSELLNLGEPCPEPMIGRQGENDLFNAGLHYVLQHCWHTFRSTKNELHYNELHPAIAKAVHLICDEDVENIPISQLAKQCGISSSRIVPLFHKEVGMTITEFRNRQKLERFFSCYSPKGPLNLMACALDAGFGSYAQFYRIFKQSTGLSPKEYFG